MSIFKGIKKIRSFVLLLAFCGLILFPAFCQENNLEISFLDVGEGEAIFIKTPQDKNILIDSGNVVSGFKALNALRDRGVNDLEYLILTHPHLDHIGGVFLLGQALDIRHICDNGQDLAEKAESEDIYRYYLNLIRNNKKYRVLSAGDRLNIGSVNFDIIWPVTPFIFSDWNVNSLVIMIEYNNFRCLLTGDLTSLGEKELLRLNSDLGADILKVGHHGYIDATSEEFLGQVRPEVAIISIDKGNIRGYPSEKIVKRLEDTGSQVFQTAKSGDITVVVEDNGHYFVETSQTR